MRILIVRPVNIQSIICIQHTCAFVKYVFSSCIARGFLPESMLSVVLVPVIKDKAGKMSYRPT